MTEPILKNLTIPPNAGRHELYRWCDYIELRCLAHTDHRFSRDALAESLDENSDSAPEDEGDEEDEEPTDDALTSERNEQHAANCFKHLRWRHAVFAEHWPFEIDQHALEIRLKDALNDTHIFYLSLLLSASLRYCPKKRRRSLTGLFEHASMAIFKNLLPPGSNVHAFGAAESVRYKGHLFDRLSKLANDIRGTLDLKREHFAPHDTGDGGLDLVGWHDLGDERKGIPISFAQCGCTTEGWPNKQLEASPAHLAGHLNTFHDWATYYFMPLDLSTEIDGKMDWQMRSDFSRCIVIDRLRFIRLGMLYGIGANEVSALPEVTEAKELKIA